MKQNNKAQYELPKKLREELGKWFDQIHREAYWREVEHLEFLISDNDEEFFDGNPPDPNEPDADHVIEGMYYLSGWQKLECAVIEALLEEKGFRRGAG